MLQGHWHSCPSLYVCVYMYILKYSNLSGVVLAVASVPLEHHCHSIDMYGMGSELDVI